LLRNGWSSLQRNHWPTFTGIRTLSTLALLPEIQAVDIRASGNIFKAVLTKNPNYRNITLVNLNGDVVASAIPSKKANLADRKHFREALQRKDFAPGEYMVTRVGSAAPAFAFAYPVLDATGMAKAVLTVAIELTHFEHLNGYTQLMEESYISITDHQGIRLMNHARNNNKEKSVGKPIMESVWDIASQAQQTGIVTATGVDGLIRIFAFEQIRLADNTQPYMYALANVPETLVLAPANQLLMRNLILMLLATGGALFIAWNVGRSTLVFPLKHLLGMTREFAKGNLETRNVQTGTAEEFRVLNESFHDMADSLLTTQNTLGQNEARFRLVMDSLSELICVTDMETQEILFTNETWRTTLGDMTEKTCWHGFPKDQSSACPCNINHFLLEEKKNPGVMHHWDFLNPVNERWYHVQDRSISWIDGRSVRLEVATNITKRKQAEAEQQKLESQLQQKFKMEAVGVLAGGMAHNFNNNLSIILGNVELSKLKLSAPNEIGDYLDNAKTAVLRSRDLIKQILTYSRQNSQDKIPTKLPLIIDETLQLLDSTLPATINLQLSIAEDSRNSVINADASQIQECLINLCNNAVHAMNEAGDITISLENTELRKQDISVLYENKPGRYTKLSVQDTGCGISAEAIDKIFDLFYTTKGVDEGTGIGLSTLQGIVKQHEGIIKVNSVLGAGTTFELYFPIIERRAKKRTETIQNLPRGNEKILFIDDQESLAEVWSQMLREYGYQVTTEINSSKALENFKQNPHQFDLVITDQTMPNITGKDLIKEMLEIKPDILTILCTGYSTRIAEEETKQLGIKAFCMKPLDLPQFLHIIRRVLDGK